MLEHIEWLVRCEVWGFELRGKESEQHVELLNVLRLDSFIFLFLSRLCLVPDLC